MNKIEGQIRIPSGCAISAVISKEGKRMTGEKIIESMKPMHDRSNGLGGGFAAYGIYPEYKDFFALHMFLDDRAARKNCEAFLRETMEIVHAERIPTRTTPAITDEPLIWRFFVTPLRSVLASMQVDADYLLRKQGLSLEEMACVIAAPFWSTIARKDEAEQKKLLYLRKVFASLLITGPFSIILGFDGGLMALNDRLKLRSMVVGEKDDKVFIASEEAAIRVMEPDAENIYAPAGGEPVIVRVKEGKF